MGIWTFFQVLRVEMQIKFQSSGNVFTFVLLGSIFPINYLLCHCREIVHISLSDWKVYHLQKFYKRCSCVCKYLPINTWVLLYNSVFCYRFLYIISYCDDVSILLLSFVIYVLKGLFGVLCAKSTFEYFCTLCYRFYR